MQDAVSTRCEGLLTVRKVLLRTGEVISPEKAVAYGFFKPQFEGVNPQDWKLDPTEIPLGKNLFVDIGRQQMAYAFGNRSPITDYVCRNFSIGTGTTPPKVTDMDLENPLAFYGGSSLKPIDSVEWPDPFISLVLFTIAASEANGYLITEMGLFSGSGNLFARRVFSGINKTSDHAPTLGWRIRW